MRKVFVAVLLILLLFVTLCACGTLPADDTTTHYFINAVYDAQKKTLECTQRVSYYNDTGVSLSELRFNLFPLAFRKDAAIKPVSAAYMSDAFYNGESYGGMKFGEIHYNAKSAVYLITGEDKTVLSLQTDNDLPPKERAEITMDYTVYLPETHTRIGVTRLGANLNNFYPVLCVFENGGYTDAPYYAYGDPFYSNIANYTVQLSYPSSGLIAATGTEAEKHTENGIATSVFTAENVRDFAAVYLDNGRVISDRTEGVDINYYYSADTSPHKTLAAGKAALSCYISLFGHYPYSVFNIVDTNFVYGGMEYPQLVLINSELTGFAREYTVAHEAAHQWWYGLVGSDNVRDAWQDEGLTEFSTALYFKKTGRQSVFEYILSTAYDTYIYAAATLNKAYKFDGVMRRATYDFPTEAAYVVTAYDKGILLNYCLYNTLGESEYLNALRRYLDRNIYKIATPEDYKSSFLNCDNLIDCWLYGKVIIGGAKYT